MRLMLILVVTVGFFVGCGGTSGGSGGGGAGGTGGSGSWTNDVDFDPCEDAITTEELEDFAGIQFKDAKPSKNSCDWESVELAEFNVSVTIYPNMDDEMYQHTKNVFSDWDIVDNVGNLGEKASFAYRDSMIQQAAVLAVKAEMGVFTLITGTSIGDADETKEIIRKITEKYLNKF